MKREQEKEINNFFTKTRKPDAATPGRRTTPKSAKE
jgi:hypothetical protein